MFDFKKLFGTFINSISSKLTKKAYTSGIIIVTASIISVMFLGVNGFCFSSIEKGNSYQKTLDEDEVVVEKEELSEIIEVTDEVFSQIDESVFSMQNQQNQATYLEQIVSDEILDEELDILITALVENTAIDSLKEAKYFRIIKEAMNNHGSHGLMKEEEDTKELVTSALSTSVKLSDEDYEALLRIVEAEATGEDIQGKIMVANVVLNRVSIDRFPNSVYDVVHQTINGNAQFSPIDDGRYLSVTVTDTTRDAVERALAGEDYAKGALFFVARSLASENAVSWFDKNLDKVAAHGCHEFYNYY